MTTPDPVWEQIRRRRHFDLVRKRDLNEVVLARRIFALRMQGCPSTATTEQVLAFAKQQAHISIEAAIEFEDHAFHLLEDQYQ